MIQQHRKGTAHNTQNTTCNGYGLCIMMDTETEVLSMKSSTSIEHSKFALTDKPKPEMRMGSFLYRRLALSDSSA